MEVQYFGALAIHHKITHCWDELPKDKVDELRQEIFQLIFRFSNGPKGSGLFILKTFTLIQ